MLALGSDSAKEGTGMRSSWRFILGVVAISVAACAPPAARTGQAPTAPQPESRGPKVLTIAIQTELKGFIRDYSGETAGIGGVSQPPPIVHNYLVADNGMGEFVPMIATEKPSVNKGT